MRNTLALFLLWLSLSPIANSQNIMGLVPTQTATHTAVQNGSWFNPATWNTGTVPGDAAIVYIPANRSVTYEGSSNAHLLAVRVDG